MLVPSPRDLGADTLPLRLRPTAAADLPAIFEMQSDPESNAMAGTKPRTREVFFAAWERNFTDPGISSRVIELGGEHERRIVGCISRFQADGHDSVGYWIARTHWGKGIASRALAMFLAEEPRRPLHATAARGNAPSRRILEKCGFRCVGFRMGEETERFTPREIADFVLAHDPVNLDAMPPTSLWPDHLDAVIAAPEHHRVLLDNPSTRVLETRIAPGEGVSLHTHRWPAVFYFLAPGDIVRRGESGVVEFDSRHARPGPRPGEAVWSPPLGPHTLENVGATAIHIISVEIKAAGVP